MCKSDFIGQNSCCVKKKKNQVFFKSTELSVDELSQEKSRKENKGK